MKNKANFNLLFKNFILTFILLMYSKQEEDSRIIGGYLCDNSLNLYSIHFHY